MEESRKPQTIATEKYMQKAGIIAKTYKLKREVAEEFAKACKKTGVSQSEQLTRMMEEFIESQKK